MIELLFEDSRIKNYITPHGFSILQNEFNYLMKQERPEMTKTVKWAAALGDRSENADYKYGKQRLREIDRRLRFLTRRIDDAIVIDPVKQATEKIHFGATVTIAGDIVKVVSIVGVDESDPRNNLVSWLSPIGKSLLGKEVGDAIEVQTPNDIIGYEIIKIEYIEVIFKVNTKDKDRNES